MNGNAAIEWANGLAAHWARGMWPVLWQTAALAAIVGLTVLCVRRTSPALRFWLWMLVPLRLLAMPLITITLPVLAPPPAIQPPAVIAPSVVVSRSDFSPAPPEVSEPAVMLAEPFAAPIAAPKQSVRVSAWTWLAAAWAVGVLIFSLRLARGLLKMRRIARLARETGDARVRNCARDAAALLGLRKTPGILLSNENVSPFVLGFFHPRIVLPAALADCVTPDELRTVLAHEFAHVRRRDALIGWVLACCDLIYFFNPVVHFVQRRIMFERERACDEQVLALANAPRAVYARALLSAAGLSRGPSQRLSCAPVLLESGRHLERRLKSIADERRPSAALSRKTRLALLAIAFLALPGITLTARSATPPELTRENLLNIIKEERDSIATYHVKYSETVDVKLPSDESKRTMKYNEYEEIRSDGKVWASYGWEKGAPPLQFAAWNQKVLKEWQPITRRAKISKPADLTYTMAGGSRSLGYAMLADTKDRLSYPSASPFLDLVVVLEAPQTVVAREKHGGSEAVVVRNGTHTIWLDPARGYAVLDQVYDIDCSTGKTPCFRNEHVRFQDCGNGLWLPTETIRYEYLPRNKPEGPAGALCLVLTLKASVVEVNKQYPDSLFDLELPNGTKVEDQVANVTYEVGKEKANAGPMKPQSPATEARTYSGVVVDKETGKPIQAATVTVRRMILSATERRTLEETRHQTDAQGRYTFTIPPEQAAVRALYIELDVSHPDYVGEFGIGYALSMILKNEKLGERPFFERISLAPGAPVTGTVVAPNGKPLAGVEIIGDTMRRPRDFTTETLSRATTDAQGAFRLIIPKEGDGIFWLLPKEYAASAHVTGMKRGDQGRIVVERGIILSGRVVDEPGMPASGVWVVARGVWGAPTTELGIPLGRELRRASRTDANGEFTMAPLSAGEYDVNLSEYPMGPEEKDRTRHPLPGVFIAQRVTLKAAEPNATVELRSVPSVVVEGQYYDSKGKPRSGHEPSLSGKLPNDNSFNAMAFVDATGRITVRAPKGLRETTLLLHTNEHSALRARISKNAPYGRQLDCVQLGTLEKDVKGIEVVRYEAPIVLVMARAEDGSPIKTFTAEFQYSRYGAMKEPGVQYPPPLPAPNWQFDKQDDGRLRSRQLLPDDEFTLTVYADGYEPRSETLKLSEGAVKELDVKLQKK